MKCIECGVEFEAKRRTAQYCRSSCRVKHLRKGRQVGGLEKPIERPVAVEPERVVVNPEYIKAGPEADVEVIVHPKVGVSVSTLPPAIQAVLGRVKAPAAPDLARPQG